MSLFNKLTGLLMVLLVFFAACKKDDVEDSQNRLFRPVGTEELKSEGNWVAASWQAIKGAETYTVQLSRDTFRTIDATQTVDTNYILFENLLWSQNYQVQVRANAKDTTFNSKMSYLGNVKTAKFPSILTPPTLADATDEALKISWTNSGNPVTSIKVLKASDSSVVKEVTLTATDVTNKYKIVTGLPSNTQFIVLLYSGTTLRGADNYATKQPETGTIIDLRNIIGVPSILRDTLPDIPSGSTVLLRRGETYTITTTTNLDKSVRIKSGDDLMEPAQAIIYFTSNFNISANSTIDFIEFRDVRLYSDSYASRYVFNINTTCTIGKISFESCTAEIFRGILRTQSNPAIIENFTVNNCIMDSLAGYGVITVDVATSKANNISITNSTIYKAEKIVTSRNNSNSVVIENCTINEAPAANNYLIDYSTSGTNNVTSGIKLANNIFGAAKAYSTAGVRGIRASSSTSIDASNNYTTSDYILVPTVPPAAPTPPIPNVIPYAGPSTALWQDPVNGNFRFKDNTFAGKNNSGDPRWR
jgi:hypothetical protein